MSLVPQDLERLLQETLGHDYRLERELGGGGMARVFLAEETTLGRRVVVKVLRPELGLGISAERFSREIRLAATLQDPRIVPLLTAGHSADLPYYTMPFVEGETLRARLGRGPVPVDEAVGILRDVALALEYAHGRGVVHRDIKPENILLSGRTAVVADFGIAKAIAAAADPTTGSLTTVGAVVGTPAYMAPEQAAGDDVRAGADLYAWGVIGYEMLSGSHPFGSRPTPQALLAAHIAERAPPLGERRRDLPPSLTSLIDRCLAKDPADRPASASEIVAALGSVPGAVAARPGRRRMVLAAVAILLVVAGPAAWLVRHAAVRRWAREAAIPTADRQVASDLFLAAYRTLRRAAEILPGDTAIARSLAERVVRGSFASTPAGATVEVQDYLAPDSAWYRLGTTPFEAAAPSGFLRWRVSKSGLGTILGTGRFDRQNRFALDSALQAGPGMVRVGAAEWGNDIAFVGWVGPYQLPAFDLDRFEVTNRDYQRFVDQGGYREPRFWTEPVVEGGRQLSWEEVQGRFRDRTGRAGPAGWEGGHFPEGQGDYPVGGVSWFEASAYAAFVGKRLPTFAQWFEAAPDQRARFVVQQSNIARPNGGPAPVGAFKGLGHYGTYDMAGNVREWASNALEPGKRFILGGAWNSQTYLYADPQALSPFDRSLENGFRCVRNLGPLPEAAVRPMRLLARDFARYRPAADPVFAAYRLMYGYPRTALLHERRDGAPRVTPDWTVEKVSYDAAYGNERITAYLFLPKGVRPPYQAVVFMPSARVLDQPSSADLGDVTFFDYVVKSGRAVMYPVYQETYERRSRNVLPGQDGGRSTILDRAKDVGRTIDYLATRPDIAADRLAYLGVSMGAAEGVIYTTLEQDRLKAAIFLDGGYFLNAPSPGVDQADFAPRLRLPVLMINGRYDITFSPERSQEPLFRMLGTGAAEKRRVVLETPHDVRADRATLVRSVLDWLDRYLGRVE